MMPLMMRKARLLQAPQGQHIVVVGGGKTGAAVARLLLREGATVTVVDDAATAQVESGLQHHGLLAQPHLTIVGGGIDVDVVRRAAMLLLSPGVPRRHPAIAAVLSSVPVANEVELAMALMMRDGHAPRVWAITGTNGKSTTTTMAGAIAQQIDPQAFVGGNLGTPLCARLLSDVPFPRIVVVELSSYQLETITHLGVHAATITNLTPDHLDRYPSVADYYAAKQRLLQLVVPDGAAVLNGHDAQSTIHLRAPDHLRVQRLGAEIGVDVDDHAIRIGGERLRIDNPHLVGLHNWHNAACAAGIAVADGVSMAQVGAGLAVYNGIAHRLQLVGVHRGVTWWNDSKATNVDAAVTAVRSFQSGVHLIAGGTGKGSPYQPLVDAARGVVVGVYTIGDDAPAVASAFAGVVPVHGCQTLARAVERIQATATPGQHLLLSPACASFDQFKDYVDRGNQLVALFSAAQEPS